MTQVKSTMIITLFWYSFIGKNILNPGYKYNNSEHYKNPGKSLRKSVELRAQSDVMSAAREITLRAGNIAHHICL